MADAPISYAILTGIFIEFDIILFAARVKRLAQMESHTDASSVEVKRSPA